MRKPPAFSWILRDESDTLLAPHASRRAANPSAGGGRGVSLAHPIALELNFQLSGALEGEFELLPCSASVPMAAWPCCVALLSPLGDTG